MRTCAKYIRTPAYSAVLLPSSTCPTYKRLVFISRAILRRLLTRLPDTFVRHVAGETHHLGAPLFGTGAESHGIHPIVGGDPRYLLYEPT